MKKETLQKAIEECGCEIVCTNATHLNSDVSGPGGSYNTETGVITIATQRPIPAQYGSLIHEIGHHLCKQAACRCMRKWKRILMEVHAEKYSLARLLKEEKKSALSFNMATVRCWLNSKKDNVYNPAAKKITKTKLWRRCKKFIEQPK